MKFKLSCNSIEKVGKPSFFSVAQCEALFKALLLHDEINLEVSLPKPRPESYTQVQLNEYFQLSHQLWRDGLSRLLLLEMIEKIYHQGKLKYYSGRFLRDTVEQHEDLQFPTG